MENRNMQKTTFWKFLNDHNIVIPMIQRDYAQGRIGKEKLREKFLNDLKQALDGELTNNETTLKLDFVYGSIESNSLNPLDGQQRLTTLWLLHWYIAYKAGKLKENKSIFKKFSYETRVSSHDFCKKISDFHVKSNKKIIKIIQNQTWFLSAWKQDPTIQAMCNMLGGTPKKDNEGKEIIDGIEEIFVDCQESDYINYWEKLTANNCPIIFYYLDLQGLKLSDDLYIKMNARGKHLTNFESFKADLVGYINEKEEKKERDKSKTPLESITHKLDVDWINIFWKNRSPEQKIDEIYFTFINRFLLNCLVTANDGNNNYRYTQENIEQIDLFKHIYGGDAREYNNFDVYKEEQSFYMSIERLEKTLDNFCKSFYSMPKECINALFSPTWNDVSSFCFIPEYVKDETEKGKYKITTISQAQRVVFYAICCYFEKGEYEEKSLKQWMRIVWNIVENANIENPQAMIGALRLIDELSDESHRLYEILANSSFYVKSNFAKEQIEEEKEKARLIVKDKINSTKNEWEEKILEAEKQPYFKGKIAYLLKTSDNNIDRFEQLLKLSQEKIIINKEHSLLSYLTYVNIERLPLYLNISEYKYWKEILTNKKSEKATIEFFRNNFAPQPNDASWSDWKRSLITDFNEIMPLSCTIRNYYTNGWWGYDQNDVFVYVNSNIAGAKLLSSKRKGILKQLIDNKIINDDFPSYPNTNDHGRLWINQHSFTQDFKQKLEQADKTQLFLSKSSFEIKLRINNHWDSVKIDLINTDDVFKIIIERVKEFFNKI